MTQLSLDLAQRKAAAGMKQALDHAEDKTPGWSNMAYSFLLSFARTHQHFISEDVSGASKQQGLPQPPTDRAFGQIYRRAQKEGIIVQDGTGVSKRRNASICIRWRSMIYQGEAA